MDPAVFSFKYKNARHRQKKFHLGGGSEVIHNHLKRCRLRSQASLRRLRTDTTGKLVGRTANRWLQHLRRAR
eukprot:15349653-Alexandrium_andersonii.AAC.1